MFDSLDAVLADGMTRLADGAAHPGSAWRNLCLGTVGLDGAPQLRTVVLRRFDQGARMLEVHTDARAAKHAELSANPKAALHGWDPAAQVQLRVAGHASLHTRDDVADAAWALLRPASRDTYRVRPGPGTVLAAPGPSARIDDAAARDVFCVVRLAITGLEWLQLRQGSHLRARFTWADEQARAIWLVP